MRRTLLAAAVTALVVGVVAVAVAGAARPRPAVCVKQVTGGQPPTSRDDAVLLCAQPLAVTASVAGRWSTCASTPPGADEDCETGSWTARYRSSGPLQPNGLSAGTMTWYGKGTGTLTCRRDRANTPPDAPGTPLVERFHRTGTFPIRQVTVAARSRGSRVILTADGTITGAASNRAVLACGVYLLGWSDPTTAGKAVAPGALLRQGTIRVTVRQSGTVGTVAVLVGGPLRGSATVDAAVVFRG